SGGDRDFMRPIAEEIYDIPPERIIGSSQALDYHETDEGTDVLYKSEMEFFDDGPTKPVRIWSRIGRRPIAAGGNSNGDIPMLRFARGPKHEPLRLLLLHDDAEREFDYTAGAEEALARADEKGWTVISIANDWSTVFE
ncbi:MAG TPA: haloacid dehalogenase-like hydrolase, partial [Acidimicrobiia bacterium]